MKKPWQKRNRKVFNYNGYSDDHLLRSSGQLVDVLREVPSPAPGTEYLVRFPDGTERLVFEEELSDPA